MRAMFNKDIATGTIPLSDNYSTRGPSSTWGKSEVLPSPEPECYILNPRTCTEETYALVKNNTALIRDYIVVGRLDVKSGNDGEDGIFDGSYSPIEDNQKVLKGQPAGT